MKTLLVLFLLSLIPSAFAQDAHMRQTTAPAPVTQASDTDRHSANLYGAAAVSGLATTALREKQYGTLWAFGGTVSGAAVIEAMHVGAYNNSNVWYAVGGAAVGTIGTCAVFFRKGFVGCGIPF